MRMDSQMIVRLGLGVFAALALMFAMPGLAVADSAWWSISASSRPTYLPPGGEGKIVLTAANFGDAPASGEITPITITDVLPSGLTPTAIATSAGPLGALGELQCASLPAVSCSFNGVLQPDEPIEVDIAVEVAPDAPTGALNDAAVSGGGLPGTTSRQPITVSGDPVPFGVENYQLRPENEGGAPDTQAGSHPFQLTTNTSLDTTLQAGQTSLAALPKDLSFNLPAGLVGDPNSVPQCTDLQFSTVVVFANQCPTASVLGVAMVTLLEPSLYGPQPLVIPVPVFNLVPHRGEPARFGFEALSVPVTLDTKVRTGTDYGVVVSATNIPESAELIGSQVTFWGVPDDPRHDSARGWHCVAGGFWNSLIGGTCASPEHSQPAPFLTLPTSCTGSLATAVAADSWDHPAAPESFAPEEALPALDGCGRLGFEPAISVAPDGQTASTPTGLTFNVHVPQEISLNPTGLAEADVMDTSVTLPAGVQLSPSAADGLQACSDTQIGFIGTDPQTGLDHFTPDAPSCPDASKIATVKIKTPLLPNALEGAVYLAAPQNFAGPPLENPFGSLVAMYIVAKDPVSGVLVKLPGKVTPDPVSGQLVGTFDETPQLPFEDLELHFFGTARAPLSTAPLCGRYTTTTSIAPWSGNVAVAPSSSFDITSGPAGAPCADPQPFSPGFTAGATNLQANAFTPFTVTMTRPDADQPLGRIEMRMAPGLLGTLSNVKLCGEPQAALGTCGPESLIGHTVVSAGLGGDPYTVTGGRVYITTGYKGAPYGLSIVNPAVAGPFVLNEGSPIVVRASVAVDPHTAQLTITSDALPTILDGIPLQLQHVDVTIDRERFTFNPSNCSRQQIAGTLTSSQGATIAVSTPFQVTDCAALPFKPKLTAVAGGKTSRSRGANLKVKLVEGVAGEANVRSVKVDLPKQLPSRLTTLQQACAAATFETNPAGCPAGSIVGRAKAITPVIPVALEGPAYFVSHGGEAFPSLIVVLQGYGVTIDLVGSTFISKKGITSSTFKGVPDVPVGSFELTLPQGRYSALAATGNLCKSKLAMPTAIVAQNGLAIHQSTKITVSGCAKRKAAKKANRRSAKHKRLGRG